jgi:hypothetical protein
MPSQTARWGDWPITEHNPPLLFNVEADPGEHYNAAADHPGGVADLVKLIEKEKTSVKPGALQKLVPLAAPMAENLAPRTREYHEL